VFPEQELPRLLEGFEILQRLGAGGVGKVYLARSKAGRLVAIKVFDEAKHDEGFADTLAREASLCARLNHPAIVQVRRVLQDEDFAGLVFEYVPGVALARLLRFCASHGVRLPDDAAWYIVERVLSALAYAHSFKDDFQQPTPIVHRDVSPSNVLVDWEGDVKITDFGLAKMLGVSPVTRLGLVKGTLGCMAPEQARGEAVTERADVYAAALLAWRLATGRVPFAKHQRDEWELLRAMRNPRIKPLSVLRPDLPEALLWSTGIALEPDPSRRELTAVQFAAVIRNTMNVEGGRQDLAGLLTRWKGALERTVSGRQGQAAFASKSDGTPRTEPSDSTSQGRVAHTLRYEEVALAFDDDIALDAPTFEAHALSPAERDAFTPPPDRASGEHAPLPAPAGPFPSAPPPPPAALDGPIPMPAPAGYTPPRRTNPDPFPPEAPTGPAVSPSVKAGDDEQAGLAARARRLWSRLWSRGDERE
jgi:serine/threonine-protein kinase